MIIENIEILHKILGSLDKNLVLIEEEFDVKITIRENFINLIGNDKEIVEVLLKKLLDIIKYEGNLDEQKVNYYINKIKLGETSELDSIKNTRVCLDAHGKSIHPKTFGQKKYIDAIEENVVVFGVGPAGTGKTYLAVAMAVKEFRNKNVSKIIITRPAVEAGENLGFLPGDLEMKIDPYLRPLYDALYNILGAKTFTKYKENGLIEVAPLAYMRGRTLDDAFIILDEAQNSTIEQMKMFLTRFGFGSKVVVNGDITQIDLKKNQKSGLVHAIGILDGLKDINIIKFDVNDIVRHKLVGSIINRYEEAEKGDVK
jgi:phosphate starvation-inducible PhoH-like protein